MIVTYNWLKEFVDCDITTAELADLLTMLGLEVEGVSSRFDGMDEVVVAVVEQKQQHPNADKLSLCTVNNGKELLPVVCGAQNFAAGDKVALAQVGAVLPGNFKIKRSKIRGVESCGMLCSEKELGMAEDSDGIMILPSDAVPGTPLFDALGLKDTVFEIGLTPNRADCLSVIGIAREIAAKLKKKVTYPAVAFPPDVKNVDAVAQVVIEAPDLCPRYTARYVSGCTVAPSPQWLVNRLQSVGLRAINNVVDVTNYVLMEYGHPLHAFDYRMLDGGKIVVRKADEGEKFTSLDGQERILSRDDLTIRDGRRVVALAGIMGGENSEISPATTDILLESAYFDPSTVRRTSKRLGLHTESSHRFERGTDWNVLPLALDRAASLIAELAGGTIVGSRIDVHPVTIAPKFVNVRIDRINSILGLELTLDEIADLFVNLEFTVQFLDQGVIAVGIPSFRVDLEREIDLVEEVARLNGYDKIPFTMPTARVFSDRPPRPQRMERQLRDLLVGLGFNEVVNFGFIAPDVYDRILLDKDDFRRNSVALLNPLVEEQSVMRTTLLPGILETAARNCSYRILSQKIFELRRVYHPKEGKELPDEPLTLAGLVTGQRYPEGWNQPREQVDFFDAKGVAENVLQDFRIQGVSFSNRDIEPFYHPGKACTLILDGKVLGTIGELHPAVQGSFSFERPVYYFEIDCERLFAASNETIAAVPPSRFPETFRDIAMLLAEEVPAAEIVACIRSLNAKDIGGVEIFDLYHGEHVPPGQKSVAVRVKYCSSERTLTDDEVTRSNQKVIDNLRNKLNAVLR
jgi:phenylalanyl-tRNA synthetase beta chain